MQFLQAQNEIALSQKAYRRGIITYGEYLVKLGSILTAFQLAVDKDGTIEDWELFAPYKALVGQVNEALI